jgi:hypothetical protein
MVLSKTLLNLPDETVRNFIQNIYTEKENYRMLYEATEAGDTDLMEKMVRCGVDINKEYDYGYMYVAIRENKIESAKLLLDYDFACYEEIVYAAQCGRAEIMEMMLEKGWDLNIKKTNDSDVLYFLSGRRHKQLIPILDRYIDRFDEANKEKYKTIRLEMLF